MNTKNVQQIDEIVINWHITEGCNYKCQYCYAHWDKDKSCRDIIHDTDKTKKLLTEIARYFSPNNYANPLRKNIFWTSIRLNIAGGEPLLYPEKVIFITKEARKLGMKVSIITNGSRLTPFDMRILAPDLSMIGLSLDSTTQPTNKDIGRQGSKEQQLSIKGLHNIISAGQSFNPDMKLKINTVVTRFNADECMEHVIALFQPERWKVLRVLPVVTNKLNVSQKAFDLFVEYHRQFELNMRVEDNHDMTESYIMINPKGQFFQNQNYIQEGYRYSPLILEEGIEVAFLNIKLSSKKYVDRYVDLLSDFNQSTVKGEYV